MHEKEPNILVFYKLSRVRLRKISNKEYAKFTRSFIYFTNFIYSVYKLSKSRNSHDKNVNDKFMEKD